MSGGWVAKFLSIPHGLPENAFVVIAAIAALVGFELGSFLGAWNKLLAGLGALVCAVLAYFAYYWMLDVVSAGPGGSLLLMALFAVSLLTFFGAFGIFGIQILEELKAR